MLFSEPRFFLFFAAVFVVYWALRSARSRKTLLLIASYFFYAAWDYRFLALILLSTVIDYFVGLSMPRVVQPSRRRLLLSVSIVANLTVLGFFKYANFFADSLEQLLALFGLHLGIGPLAIVLPVGISFYTFQTMSYTIDVYRKKLEPIPNFFDFALFVAFFPQLVAGPIVRAIEFFPQLEIDKRLKRIQFRPALTLFLIGFIKKVCIADNLAIPVDQVFASPDAYTAASMWIAVISYAIQIYCDFSGYTDMAIAVAALLGYQLPLNFQWPYFAANIREFWRRWHITLSSFLRDYLYISLGGNRGKSRWFTYRNIMITMLLGGLWHGAAWTFVFWGGLHGLGLILHRELAPRLQRLMGARVMGVLGVACTFYFVCVAWIFFRAETFSDAIVLTRGFAFFSAHGLQELSNIVELAGVILGLAVVHYATYKGFLGRMEWLPDWAYALTYGVTVALALPFIPLEYRPFIYFQF